MSIDDVKCPYCGADNEICHDDGQGYTEGVLHHQPCRNCDKTFAFETSICFYYEAFAAPCIDGDEEHKWKETNTFPRCYRRLECSVCGAEKEIEGIQKEREAYWKEINAKNPKIKED